MLYDKIKIIRVIVVRKKIIVNIVLGMLIILVIGSGSYILYKEIEKIIRFYYQIVQILKLLVHVIVIMMRS